MSEVLERSGLDRTRAELDDERTWIGYDELIALLEAAADVLDEPDVGRRIGEEALEYRESSPLFPLLRALGSPGQVFVNIARTSAKLQTVGDAVALETGEGHALVAFSMREGFTRHRMHCDYMAGMLSQVPPLFDLPPARVEHEVCAAQGADRCVYRLTWRRRSRLPWRAARERAALIEERLLAMTTQVENLQTTAADLVSADGVPEVLSRIASRAATAVRAPRHILAVNDEGGGRQVHFHGMSDDEAEVLADDLLATAGDSDGGRRLVVDVASSTRQYGSLAAVYDEAGAFFPEEERLLASYARHAAAALDVATALEEARSEGETNALLLDLARALVDATTTEEVCERLAATIPTVAGSDWGSVYLWDEAGELLRQMSSTASMRAPGAELPIRKADTPILSRLAEHPGPLLLLSSTSDDYLRTRMTSASTARTAVVPITSQGDFLGVVVASWRKPSPVATLDDHLVRRLQGLADQAATALRNADLLAQVRRQALHDALTGLPNQVLLQDRMRQALAAAVRLNTEVAVFYLDLDRFKEVNDRMGHEAGNEVLRRVADRLAAAVRASDTVARLSGDEFTVVAPGVDEAGAVKLAEELVTSLSHPYRVAGEEVVVTPSVGVALGPRDGTSAEALLHTADLAMYRAKQRGRSTWYMHAAEGGDRFRHRLELERALGPAIEGGQLRLLYQPVVALGSGDVEGVEALVRWQHPTGGLLAPSAFLSVAEEAGLSAALDEWVLRTACAQLVAWRRDGLDMRLSVNVSGRHVERRRLARMVAAVLEDVGLEAGWLELDVAEAVAVEDRRETVAELAAVRSLGVSVAIDDFGPAHPSVARLRHIPADTVKIHPALVSELDAAGGGTTVIAALAAMAGALGLRVLAEGVETPAQAAAVHRAGCAAAQGHLYGRPVPAEEIERALSAAALTRLSQLA